MVYESCTTIISPLVALLFIDQSTGKKWSEMTKCQKVNDSYFNKLIGCSTTRNIN